MASRTPIRVEVVRGSVVESYHDVIACVIDNTGKPMTSWGNTDFVTFPRSAIKPIQAFSFVESGALEKFNLSEEMLSFACGSHKGEAAHIEIAKTWLKQINQTESALVCGGHAPFNEELLPNFYKTNTKISQLYNNCAGKHLGIISTCLALSKDVDGYEKLDHFAQIRLKKYLTEMTGVDHFKTPHAVDGCGIVTYALPIKSMAQGMAMMIHPKLPAERKSTSKLILSAIVKYPKIMSGNDDFVSEVIIKSKGRSIVKSGAEGIYCGLIPEKGIAFAIKAVDGAARAAQVATAAILLKFGGLTEVEFLELKKFTHPTIYNWAKEEVGHIRIAPQ